MIEQIEERLHRAPIVPLIQSDDPETAVRIAEALLEGGLSIIEVVLRTEAALHCLSAVRDACPRAIVGAGTVLSAQQATASIDASARFIVSPCLDEPVVNVAGRHSIPVFPGVATPTEVQRAIDMNLSCVKVFPAGVLGGPGMIKALSSVFKEMKFMPTGGISTKNLADYLAIPSVIACGGSWLTPADAVETGRFENISRLAREAIEIANSVRGE